MRVHGTLVDTSKVSFPRTCLHTMRQIRSRTHWRETARAHTGGGGVDLYSDDTVEGPRHICKRVFGILSPDDMFKRFQARHCAMHIVCVCVCVLSNSAYVYI